MKRNFFASILTFALTLSGGHTLAQSASSRVAEHADWNVFTGSNPKVCWTASTPTRSTNTRSGKPVDVRRGDILFYVSFSPSSSVNGQVSFTGGYPFAKGSNVELVISGQRFQLASSGEWAWPANASEDKKIVAAMKKGNQATLSARSGRGTLTKDSFSLLGFTASLSDAQNRCS